MSQVLGFVTSYHNELLAALPLVITAAGWLIRLLTTRTALKWSFLLLGKADGFSTVTVAIWNAGPETIGWLDQSRVSIEAASIIADAALLETNNPESQFRLVSVDAHRADIRFDRLDKHGGAVLQVRTRGCPKVGVTSSFVGSDQPKWVWEAASRGLMYALHVQWYGEKNANRQRWMSRYSTTSVLFTTATAPFVFYEFIRPYFWLVVASTVVGTISALRLTLHEWTADMPRSLARLLIDEETFPSLPTKSKRAKGWRRHLVFWRWFRKGRD